MRLLCDAGSVLVGATNMDEFAYGFTTENARFGATRNPHDLSRTAGGSSGGSAAAVAAGLADFALGTDTNGSVRLPAAFCGIFGFKPTYGRISTRGVYPFVKSFDHVGVFARTSADLSLVSTALMQGMSRTAVPDPRSADGGLRVGLLDGFFADAMHEAVLAAMEPVRTAFERSDRIHLEGAAEMRAAAFLITASEGGARHVEHLRQDYDALGPTTRQRLAAGLIAPAEWVARSYRLRAWFRDRVLEQFKRYDILIAPAAPCVAPKLGQKTIELGGREMPTRATLGLYTQPLTPVVLPIVAALVASLGGLPAGIQIIGAPHDDQRVLAFATHLEKRGIVAKHGLREAARPSS